MRWILFTFCFTAFSAFANIALKEFEEKIPTKKASDVHGLVDITLKNDYVTPRGLLVTNTGLTVQVLNNIVLELTPSAFINFGAWHDIWTDQGNPYVGSWNEFDWFVGATFIFQKNWKLSAQFIEFVSPPHNFVPENNAEFILYYDDKVWNLPFTFNPYIKLFYTISGDSTVVVGKRGGTYYFELGMIPSYIWLPVTLTFPTWISMGPESFWNGGKEALKHSHSHFGVFSTGIHARVPLPFIPNRIGAWYLGIGFQYYYLINNNLLQAQKFTIGTTPHRSVGVGSFNIGFDF